MSTEFDMLLRRQLPKWAQRLALDVTESFQTSSEDIVPADWTRLARDVAAAIADGAEGVVVAHGTDTLVYSAAALDIMLENAPVPIVITGAREPIEVPGSDAIQNISHALAFAVRTPLRGVFTSFAGSANGSSLVVSGARVRKDASIARHFLPAGTQAVAEVVPSIWGKPAVHHLCLAAQSSPEWEYEPDPTVGDGASLIYVHPGLHPEVLIGAAKTSKALILATYGDGTVSAHRECNLVSAVRQLVNSGTQIFLVSQDGGRVDLSQYGHLEALARLGCVSMGDATPEYALVLVMWALGQSTDPGALRAIVEERLVRLASRCQSVRPMAPRPATPRRRAPAVASGSPNTLSTRN